MNLVASAMVRGMMGASSHAEPSGVPSNRRSKTRGESSSANGATDYDSAQQALEGGKDARQALKGTETQAQTGERSWHQPGQWFARPGGADAIQISDAGRKAPGNTASVPQNPQDGAKNGPRLSIKI